jgi:hypothetical protein
LGALQNLLAHSWSHIAKIIVNINLTLGCGRFARSVTVRLALQGATCRPPHVDRSNDTEPSANAPSESNNSPDERVGTQHEGTFRRWIVSAVSTHVLTWQTRSDLYTLGDSRNHLHYQARRIGPVGSFWHTDFKRLRSRSSRRRQDIKFKHLLHT